MCVPKMLLGSGPEWLIGMVLSLGHQKSKEVLSELSDTLSVASSRTRLQCSALSLRECYIV